MFFIDVVALGWLFDMHVTLIDISNVVRGGGNWLLSSFSVQERAAMAKTMLRIFWASYAVAWFKGALACAIARGFMFVYSGSNQAVGELLCRGISLSQRAAFNLAVAAFKTLRIALGVNFTVEALDIAAPHQIFKLTITETDGQLSTMVFAFEHHPYARVSPSSFESKQKDASWLDGFTAMVRKAFGLGQALTTLTGELDRRMSGRHLRRGSVSIMSRTTICPLDSRCLMRVGHDSNCRIKCSHTGCDWLAMGNDNCVKHGGGNRCSIPLCIELARTGTVCLTHRRRCKFDDCVTPKCLGFQFCKKHGGGQRCIVDGCRTAARNGGELCKQHGGGQRCIFDGCRTAARDGGELCWKHGGGQRCIFDGCPTAAQDGIQFCRKHGGGKPCNTCNIEGCPTAARDGFQFCRKHNPALCSICDKNAYSSGLCFSCGRCKHRPCNKRKATSSTFCREHTSEHLRTPQPAPVPVRLITNHGSNFTYRGPRAAGARPISPLHLHPTNPNPNHTNPPTPTTGRAARRSGAAPARLRLRARGAGARTMTPWS
jgi:hypothetical protein